MVPSQRTPGRRRRSEPARSPARRHYAGPLRRDGWESNPCARALSRGAIKRGTGAAMPSRPLRPPTRLSTCRWRGITPKGWKKWWRWMRPRALAGAMVIRSASFRRAQASGWQGQEPAPSEVEWAEGFAAADGPPSASCRCHPVLGTAFSESAGCHAHARASMFRSPDGTWLRRRSHGAQPGSFQTLSSHGTLSSNSPQPSGARG
jgi:hypothetical protein